MKIQIEENNLMAAVNIVSKAVSGKTTMPILECILIDASTEKIRLIANDMELGIETGVEGVIEDHGIIAINAGIFSEIVRKLPAGTVHIETQEEKVTIKCEKAHFSIMGHAGDDFVYLPEVVKKYGIEISQFTLKDIISKTIFSIASSETNKLMTGELFEIKNNTLSVVSLDGHRISIRRVELKSSYDDKKVIIPGKTLSDITKILGSDTEKTVRIYFNDKQALFEFNDTIVVSRLIEGEYFKVDQMISNEHKTHIRINRSEFLSCLDRATLLVKEEDKKPIILMVRDDEVELKIRTSIGAMDEIINIEKEGEDMNIGFNPKFLIDALRAIDDETVDIYLLSQRAPAFIRDEKSYCYLVLPINFITID